VLAGAYRAYREQYMRQHGWIFEGLDPKLDVLVIKLSSADIKLYPLVFGFRLSPYLVPSSLKWKLVTPTHSLAR
jgi:hypothetical protein